MRDKVAGWGAAVRELGGGMARAQHAFAEPTRTSRGHRRTINLGAAGHRRAHSKT